MRRSPGDPRKCPDCGVTADAGDVDLFLANGSTRCRECSRKLARERYPQRKAAIAETRRKRRELMEAATLPEEYDFAPEVEKYATELRVRYWIKYGTGRGGECVGRDWREVADILAAAGLDREALGMSWDVEFPDGYQLECWKIVRKR